MRAIHIKKRGWKIGRREDWKAEDGRVLDILEKPSFADPTGGATNATQKTRFLGSA
jgi:hypothetical protein